MVETFSNDYVSLLWWKITLVKQCMLNRNFLQRIISLVFKNVYWQLLFLLSLKTSIDSWRSQVRTTVIWVERITGIIHHLQIVLLECKAFWTLMNATLVFKIYKWFSSHVVCRAWFQISFLVDSKAHLNEC